MTAHGSNGNTTSITRNTIVSSAISTQNVSTIDGEDIIFGGAGLSHSIILFNLHLICPYLCLCLLFRIISNQFSDI